MTDVESIPVPARAHRKRRWLLFAVGLVLAGAATTRLFPNWHSLLDPLWRFRYPNSWVRAAPLESSQPLSLPVFDYSETTIPTHRIKRGGPRKDGIPALTNPKLVDASDARYLRPKDRIIGVVFGDQPVAYPLRILTHHEIVNDRVGGVPVAVTYCPLCDSAAVFDRRDGEKVREFGVSGLLFNSNVLMYDRGAKTESLWSQMMTRGVTGPGARKRLAPLPLELTTWDDWRKRYPRTRVLSDQIRHPRNYDKDPYQKYFASPGLMFPVEPRDDRRNRPKVRVLGIWSDTAARAYRIDDFADRKEAFEDELAGKKVVLRPNSSATSLCVVRADEGLHWVYAYWFAWYAFHPDTDVARPDGKP